MIILDTDHLTPHETPASRELNENLGHIAPGLPGVHFA